MLVFVATLLFNHIYCSMPCFFPSILLYPAGTFTSRHHASSMLNPMRVACDLNLKRLVTRRRSVASPVCRNRHRLDGSVFAAPCNKQSQNGGGNAAPPCSTATEFRFFSWAVTKECCDEKTESCKGGIPSRRSILRSKIDARKIDALWAQSLNCMSTMTPTHNWTQ
eukprot:COSAG05_NODE_1049_length_6033_cov_7.763566_5_plen_166_part_00